MLEHFHAFFPHCVAIHSWHDVVVAHEFNQRIVRALGAERVDLRPHIFSERVYAVGSEVLIEHLDGADILLFHPEFTDVYLKAGSHVYDTSHFVGHRGVCGHYER